MNAVLGFADLMAHDASLPAAQAERLGRIRSAGTHLLGLIDTDSKVSDVIDHQRQIGAAVVTLAVDGRQLFLAPGAT